MQVLTNEESETINILLERIQYLRTEVKKYKYDFLSGLKMRTDFDGYLKTLFEMYEFEDRAFTFILVDIDGLHSVNRTSGYFAGDSMIKGIAKQLVQSFQECNGTEVFRIGGDEFAVLLKGTNKEKLEELLDSIQNITYTYVIVDQEDMFASPSDLFRKVDKELVNKKNQRKADAV